MKLLGLSLGLFLVSCSSETCYECKAFDNQTQELIIEESDCFQNETHAHDNIREFRVKYASENVIIDCKDFKKK